MNESNKEITESVSGPQSPSAGYPGALELDIEKYRPYVEGFDMSEDQKIEFLKTLWAIMSAFVDLGWGVDAVHKFLPALEEFSVPELPDDSQQGERATSAKGYENEFNQAASVDQIERMNNENKY